jgi:CspA family cold shock protein
MATGTIAKLVTDRGFGFIKPENGEADLFFHVSGMTDSSMFDKLRTMQRVQYDRDQNSHDKPRAVNVQTV